MIGQWHSVMWPSSCHCGIENYKFFYVKKLKIRWLKNCYKMTRWLIVNCVFSLNIVSQFKSSWFKYVIDVFTMNVCLHSISNCSRTCSPFYIDMSCSPSGLTCWCIHPTLTSTAKLYPFIFKWPKMFIFLIHVFI